MAGLARYYPRPLTSLLDLSCSKGYFVFHAAAYDSWAQVPESEKDAVRAWYAAHGSAVPVYEGNYWGWQVVIGADGAWRVFFQSPD